MNCLSEGKASPFRFQVMVQWLPSLRGTRGEQQDGTQKEDQALHCPGRSRLRFLQRPQGETEWSAYGLNLLEILGGMPSFQEMERPSQDLLHPAKASFKLKDKIISRKMRFSSY